MLDFNFNISEKFGKGMVASIIVVVVMLLVSLSPSKNSIIGTWERTDTKMLYEFTEEGNIYLSGNKYGSITFENDSPNRIKIKIDVLWSHTILFANVEYDGDTLILSNFTDSENILGVDSNDTWVLKKIY